MAAEVTGRSAAIVGCTGLVGSQILKILTSPAHSNLAVHALARKQLPAATPAPTNLTAHVDADSAAWPAALQQLRPGVFISALGTTRAAAGGLDKQRAIDLDLNLALARAAKEGGAGTYVLISSGGSSSASRFPYTKMKGELEDAVKELGFDHTVILRPGLLLGKREESRTAEGVLQAVARGLGAVSKKLTDFWAQDVETIARAAVSATVQCVEGKREKGVWLVEQADIIAMGKAE